MKKFFKIFGIVILVAIFIGTLGFLYKKSQAKPDVFETKHLITTNIVKKTVATGSVVPKKEIEIKVDKSRLRPSDVPTLLGDCSKFKKDTGWKPEIPFERTLEDIVEYWRNH